MCPNLTAIRADLEFPLQSSRNWIGKDLSALTHDPEIRGRYSLDKESRLNVKDESLIDSTFIACNNEKRSLRFNKH